MRSRHCNHRLTARYAETVPKGYGWYGYGLGLGLGFGTGQSESRALGIAGMNHDRAQQSLSIPMAHLGRGFSERYFYRPV